jgi:hypothetical protein
VKTVRFSIATCGIFAGSVVGHLAGNGSLQVSNSHFTFLLLIAFASAVLSRKSLEGPKLAIVIALAQFGTHFFFSTSQNVELRMAISHLVFGAVSYQLVVQMDAIYESVLSAFEYLVVTVFERVEPVVALAIQSYAIVRVLHSRFIALDIARRGPPVAN